MKSRNRLQRISFLVLSLAALVPGCAWDDSLYNEFVIETEDGRGEVVQCGDSLEKIIIYKSDNSSETYCKECEKGFGKYANAFEHKLCPRDAPNCMLEDDGKDGTKGTCRNDCPSAYIVCKGKCLARDEESQNFSLSYHIQSCINDEVECDEDYYDLDKDVVNGCEIQLSAVQVNKTTPKNEDGSWNCIKDYYDFDQEATNGCEFPLRTIHVKKDSDGDFTCNDDYYDLNDDLNNLKNHQSSDGCEFQLSVVQVDKSTPKNSDGSWNCKDGYADLDDSRENGCEINGWMDSKHCGAGVINGEQGTRKEGEECINGKTCIMGVCEVSCGKEGIINCDGYCVNVKGSDNAHCGDCGKTCEINDNTSSSTAAVACGGGYCHATACNPGYRLETGRAPNTCTQCNPDEYTTSATATTCEKCPKTPGATKMRFDATRNLCVAEDCEAGWHIYKDACEENTTQHCEFKGDCAKPTYGTSACVNGTCKYACNAGYYYLKGCDKSPYCCFACPHGTYSSTGATQCSIIPAGYVAKNCDSGYDGCTDYSRCSSTTQCENMYGYYSNCVNINGYKYCTDYTETNKKSCNRSYNGCSPGQTCRPHADKNYNSYGYCN